MRKVVVNLLRKWSRLWLWLEENENGVDRFYRQSGCTEVPNRKTEVCKHCQIMVSYHNNIYQFKPIWRIASPLYAWWVVLLIKTNLNDIRNWKVSRRNSQKANLEQQQICQSQQSWWNLLILGFMEYQSWQMVRWRKWKCAWPYMNTLQGHHSRGLKKSTPSTCSNLQKWYQITKS